MKTQLENPALDADIVAAIADGLVPIELSSAARDRMRAHILRRVTAALPSGMSTVRSNEGDWRHLAPGVQIKVLHEEASLNTMSYLVRMEPGARAPVHTHAQEEHCLVLEGEVHIGEHVMRSGDWHVALPGSTHADFLSKTGCLLFIRAEMAART
jgi:quercetin dioxygenase-like cupin family protein